MSTPSWQCIPWHTVLVTSTRLRMQEIMLRSKPQKRSHHVSARTPRLANITTQRHHTTSSHKGTRVAARPLDLTNNLVKQALPPYEVDGRLRAVLNCCSHPTCTSTWIHHTTHKAPRSSSRGKSESRTLPDTSTHPLPGCLDVDGIQGTHYQVSNSSIPAAAATPQGVGTGVIHDTVTPFCHSQRCRATHTVPAGVSRTVQGRPIKIIGVREEGVPKDCSLLRVLKLDRARHLPACFCFT